MTCQNPTRMPQCFRLALLPLSLSAALLLALPTGANGDETLPNAGRAPTGHFFEDNPALQGGTSTPLDFEDHEYVNPFTGGVAWRTNQNTDVLAMEWRWVGVSEVLPLCSGSFNWSIIDVFLEEIAIRGHQAVLRPVFFGPGYGMGDGSFTPGDMSVADFVYNTETFDNPRWDLEATRNCVLRFIDEFAARYKDDLRVAYIQMGLAGLWGEHHLDGATYTNANFPSIAFQKTLISRYLDGFGGTSSDLLSSLSLDAAQAHGFFGTTDATFDNERVGFFDDTLLIANHSALNNWRQDPRPAHQLAQHKRHGWGGEAFWTPCNEFGEWVLPPRDCGNLESLGIQAERVGLNYMLGDPAFTDPDLSFSFQQLRAAAQTMGYKFTAIGAMRQDPGHLTITVENTGAAFCPYKVEVCTAQGCGGDLSTLEPGNTALVTVPATGQETQVLFFQSPRLDPNSPQKIRWSNVGADGAAGTLTVEVDASHQIFADGFESGSTSAWTISVP